MWNLYRFLQKYYYVFLFIVLELISLSLVVRDNSYQRSIYFGSGNSLIGFFHNSATGISEYFKLKRVNQRLALENVALKNNIESRLKGTFPFTKNDSISYNGRYKYVAAHVVSNSTNKLLNYITIDKGSASNVKPGDGITGPEGIVGVVKGVSKHYAVVVPIINPQLRVSSKFRNTEHFGSLVWKGNDYRFASLEGIEQYVTVAPGDTVTTSGYGSIFPEGIMVGVVAKVKEMPDGVFYDITVKLATNFKALSWVEIVSNSEKQEQIQLEKEYFNEP